MEAELQPLFNALTQTLTPDPTVIKQAEAFLKGAQSQPGYGISMLKLISHDSVQIDIRQQGSVQFKNFIKYNWIPRSTDSLDGTTPITITDDEKEQIKTHIIDLMLNAPPKVRVQLSEALTIISKHDFPRKWQSLLPQLLTKFNVDDPAIINGVLTTADSIYQRYRGQFMTDELSLELEYSQQLVHPLLAVAQRVVAAATAAATSAADTNLLQLHLSNCRLVLSIFYSMNSPGLTEEFENTLKEWMECIQTIITLAAPSIAASHVDQDQESPLDSAKSTACECLSLFMERNEEEFAPYLEVSVRNVWQQLLAVGFGTGQDSLVMSAITFLTTVVRSVHYKLFGDASVLKQICEGIVIPNVRLRDEDIELFEMNWVEYVRRDTEGSDSDTRRRAASELIRALVDKFPVETTELFSAYVSSLLAEATAAAPTTVSSSSADSWRSKDAAIYLVSALAVKGRTAAAGATATNQLVNLQEFYAAHVSPELSDPDTNARAVVKADCLRFATTFRSQLPRNVALDLFPKATSLLASTYNVVHSYAAILVDRLLSMKSGTSLMFTPTELSPYLQPLLERLFGALQMPESNENEYVMRAVMRVVVFVGASIAPIAISALKQLSQTLLAVARNPTQPGFNHYLFEALAALVRFGCQADMTSVVGYEEVLFPPFQLILQEDVQEFHPYLFQILAQLIELRAAAALHHPSPTSAIPNGSGVGDASRSLPETYMQLLPPLLAPLFWERPGNIPALSRLLRAYINAAPADIVARNLLPSILGVFQKLIASKAHDHEGLSLLNALTVSLEQSALAQYTSGIWTILFQRLQNAKTTKFTHFMVDSAALIAATKGGAVLAESMDSVQAGISNMFASTVWAPTLRAWSSEENNKVVAVGTARFICEAPALQAPGGDAVAGALLAALMHRLAVGTGGGGDVVDVDDGLRSEEFEGYSAAYAKLHNAATKEIDILPGVMDVKRDVMQRLSLVSSQQPGRFGRAMAGVSAEDQGALQEMCRVTGIMLS